MNLEISSGDILSVLEAAKTFVLSFTCRRLPCLVSETMPVSASESRMAKYMTDNVPGIFVPQDLIDELASAPKGEALNKGIEIAGRMIATLKRGCSSIPVKGK